MNDRNGLFPFPIVENGTSTGKPSDPVETADPAPLPMFPIPAAPPDPISHTGELVERLSPEDIRDLHRILEEFRSGGLGSQHPVASVHQAVPEKMAPLPIPLPVVLDTPPSAFSVGDSLISILNQMAVTAPVEQEIRVELKRILAEISDPGLALQVWTALTGVFPVRDCLRHGTPEQRLFALIALGDRFFQGLAGVRWSGRSELIKLVSRHLSEVSEGFSFLSMENEPLHPQYHERVPGASSSSSQIREMRGFLIVRRQSNQVVRLGRVWT